MNHADFANSVDRFLDGNLDFVEAAEFDLHSRDCKEGCVKKWTDRAMERLDERGSFLPDPPEPCVREETLHRLFDGDLPDELRRLVYEHLDRCPVCSAKVDQLIRSIEADFSAEFLPLDLPTLAPDPTPTVPAPSRQKSADFIVEAKSANSESLANREATAITRASVYKFVDQHRRVFELHTDREGRVFVVVPRHLQTSAPTSVFIDSDSYQLNQVAEEMFEIQNLGERDLLDFADGFSLYGLVRP